MIIQYYPIFSVGKHINQHFAAPKNPGLLFQHRCHLWQSRRITTQCRQVLHLTRPVSHANHGLDIPRCPLGNSRPFPALLRGILKGQWWLITPQYDLISLKFLRTGLPHSQEQILYPFIDPLLPRNSQTASHQRHGVAKRREIQLWSQVLGQLHLPRWKNELYNL